jgi:DNA-binding GntR family transcriptional regulator
MDGLSAATRRLLKGDVSVEEKIGLTQAEWVRRGIEQAIFSGDLAPGVALEEGRIAEQYGVSRTPVREAIGNLVQSGLVTKLAHRRAVVSRLDPGKLLELFEALSQMEGVAAQLAAKRMSPGEKSRLWEIHNTAAELLKSGDDVEAYASQGEQFHKLILNGSRNTVLIDTISALSFRVYPYRRYQVAATERLVRNQRDHDVIIEAVSRGDGDAAQAAMQQHTAEQGDALVRFLLLNTKTNNSSNGASYEAGSVASAS